MTKNRKYIYIVGVIKVALEVVMVGALSYLVGYLRSMQNNIYI
jgi:hypothetical protein